MIYCGPSISFMHVPKTAGSSVKASICGALGVEKAMVAFDKSLYGECSDFTPGDFPHPDLICYRPEDLPKSAVFVTGHLALSTLRAAYPANLTFTILREPRCRLLSHWLYWRSFRDEILAPWGKFGEMMRIAQGPLVEFLSEPRIAAQTDNLLVRMLLWPDPRIPNGAFIAKTEDEALLDDARHALESLNFVGLVEDSSLTARLSEVLGLPLDLPRANETQDSTIAERPVLSDELGMAAVDALSSRTRLDDVLWGQIFTQTIGSCSSSTASDAVFLRLLMNYLGKGLVLPSWDNAKVYVPNSDLDSWRRVEQVLVEELKVRQQESEALRVKLLDFKASKSWRFTAPLRAVATLALRLRGGG